MPYSLDFLRKTVRASNAEPWKVRRHRPRDGQRLLDIERIEVQTSDGRFIADFGDDLNNASADAAAVVVLHNTISEILDDLEACEHGRRDVIALVRCAQAAAVTLEATTRAGQGELWGVAQALKDAAGKVAANEGL